MDIKALVRDLVPMCQSDFIDGGDIQKLLVKHGCIRLETINQPCSDDCLCAEVGSEFPTQCYRLIPEFKEKP